MMLGDWIQRRRGLLFAIPAGALAVLVVVAAINFDRGTGRVKRPSRITDAEELLTPRTASQGELAKASGSLADQTAVSLAAGAWVQVADETGRLAQQYNASRLEPLPGSQLSMTEPRAMIYLKDGRVLVLRARKGVAYVPRRALESGTLEEDVEVRLFRPVGERAPDVERDVPSVVVTAEQAQFDGVLGEVRCEKAVRVATDAGSFAGEGLSLILDETGDGLERLVVDRALEPIRIDRAARALAAKRDRAPSGAPVEKSSAESGRGSALEAAPSPEPPNAAVAGSGAVDLAASPSANTSQESSASLATSRPPFYRLTMQGGVEVVRVRDGIASTITGEELVAVFSLESKGFDDFAFIPSTERMNGGTERMMETVRATRQDGDKASVMTQRSIARKGPMHGSATALLFPLLWASVGAGQDVALQQLASGGSSDSVTVRFGGKLIMVPATDAGDQLRSPDDIRFDVTGPRVEILDGRSKTRIVCAQLRYRVQDEHVEAEGRDGTPLTVSNPRMSLEGRRFEAALREGVGRIDGAGRMSFGRGVARALSYLEIAPASVDPFARMLVSRDPAASALIAARQDGGAQPPVMLDPAEFRFDPASQEIEIKWNDGVDLRFTGEGDDAKLSLARFGGGVNVFGRQFEMDSRTLEVVFAPGDGEQIDAIIADGETRVRRLGGAGSMAAGRLELFLGQNSKGDTAPRRLVAKAAVEARDERQTIWTEDLVVTFREKPKDATGERAAESSVQRSRDASIGGLLAGGKEMDGVDIDSVEAKGGVQVLLKEGARVFADTLVGDAARRRLRLTGEDVAIVRTNVIADNLRDLRFDDATRSARSDGPGRFRAFRAPIALPEGKVDRPKPAEAPTLEAAWGEALEYSEVDARRGVLDLRGDVRVRSRPSATTSDAVDAQSVLLELGIDGSASKAANEAENGAGRDATDAARTLDHFIAKGGARLENRTWSDAERTGEPRVFRVSGEHVEYDMRTREGLVVGDGAILVNIPPNPQTKAIDPSEAGRSRTPGAIGLGTDGTTRFRWKERMALEKQYDDVFRMRMEKDVEMLHAGLRADDSLSMRCDVLEATVRRPLDGTKDAPAKEKGEQGVDLGGPAELLGVKGTGRVFIRTPEQDIECGEFDYSVATGVATLTAEANRTVTIALKGQPSPIRAQQVVWDLRNGRIQVLKASGTAGR